MNISNHLEKRKESKNTIGQRRALLLLAILIVIIPATTAITITAGIPITYQANIAQSATFDFRTEWNYTSQYITFNLGGDNDTFFNGCNKNYTEAFLVTKGQHHNIGLKIQFMNAGPHEITYTASNLQQNITKSITVTNEGFNHQNLTCPRNIGQRRERYGMFDNTIVKERLTTKQRKYSLPW